MCLAHLGLLKAKMVVSAPDRRSFSICGFWEAADCAGSSSLTRHGQAEDLRCFSLRRTDAQAVHPLRGVLQELSGVVQFQFFLDAGAVGFDGLDAQAQFFGNAPRAETLPNELKHFELAVSQPLDWRNRLAGAAEHELV